MTQGISKMLLSLLRLSMQPTFESSFLSQQQFFEEYQIFIYVELLVGDCLKARDLGMWSILI